MFFLPLTFLLLFFTYLQICECRLKIYPQMRHFLDLSLLVTVFMTNVLLLLNSKAIFSLYPSAFSTIGVALKMS